MEIKRDDMVEEQHWSFKCPACGVYSDTTEDPNYSEEITCRHCLETISIIDYGRVF